MADKTEKKAAKPEKSAEKAHKKGGFIAGVKSFFGRIVKFFRDTASEMKKVVWPSKKQVLNNTGVVAVVVVISAAAIIVLDALFGLGLNLLLRGA